MAESDQERYDRENIDSDNRESEKETERFDLWYRSLSPSTRAAYDRAQAQKQAENRARRAPIERQRRIDWLIANITRIKQAEVAAAAAAALGDQGAALTASAQRSAWEKYAQELEGLRTGASQGIEALPFTDRTGQPEPEWKRTADGTIFNTRTGIGYSEATAPAEAKAALNMTGAPTTTGQVGTSATTATTALTNATGDPYGAFMAAYKGSKQEKAYGAISQDMLNSNEFLEQLPNELFRLLPSARLESFSTQRLAKLPNEDIMALVRFNPNLVGGFGADFWSKRGFPQDFVQGEIIPHLGRTDQVGLADEIKNAAAAMVGAPEVPAAAPGGAGGGAGGTGGATSTTQTTAPTVAGPAARQTLDIRGPQAVNAGQSRDALDMFLNLQGITPPPAAAEAGAQPTASMVGAPTAANGTRFSLMSVGAPTVSGGGAMSYEQRKAAWQAQQVAQGRDPNDMQAWQDFITAGPKQMLSNTAGGSDQGGGVNAMITEGPINQDPPVAEDGHEGADPLGGGGFVIDDDTGGGGSKRVQFPSEAALQGAQAAGIIAGIDRDATILPYQIDQILAGIGLTTAQAEQIKALLPGQIAIQGATVAQIMANIDIAAKQLGLDVSKFDWQRGMDTAGLEHRTADRQLQAELGYAESARADTALNLQRDLAAGYLENTGGGQATLQREIAVAEQGLANDRLALDRATSAANVALKQGDQVEAKRQFDIAQALKDRIETGRLDLDTKLGTGDLRLRQLQEERQWRQNPFSFTDRVYAMRGAPQPEANASLVGAPATGAQGAGAAMEGAPGVDASRRGDEFTPDAQRLTFRDIKDSGGLGPGLEAAAAGRRPAPFQVQGGMPLLSQQQRNYLSSSELEQEAAVLQTTGNDPRDVEEYRRKMTGAPRASASLASRPRYAA